MTRLIAGCIPLLVLSGCGLDGLSCGRGRCETQSVCITIFQGAFTNTYVNFQSGVENEFWCERPCPSGKTCPGLCLENPTDDTVDVCEGQSVSVVYHCPTSAALLEDGSFCTQGTVSSCQFGSVSCEPGKACSVGTFVSGSTLPTIKVSGPDGVDDPNIGELAKTASANPELGSALPEGATVDVFMSDLKCSGS